MTETTGIRLSLSEGSRLKDISAALCLYVHATVGGIQLLSIAGNVVQTDRYFSSLLDNSDRKFGWGAGANRVLSCENPLRDARGLLLRSPLAYYRNVGRVLCWRI
jgi:hypothetical protein